MFLPFSFSFSLSLSLSFSLPFFKNHNTAATFRRFMILMILMSKGRRDGAGVSSRGFRFPSFNLLPSLMIHTMVAYIVISVFTYLLNYFWYPFIYGYYCIGSRYGRCSRVRQRRMSQVSFKSGRTRAVIINQ